MTGSVGISAYNDAGKDFKALYREADEALYRAKLAGKNQFAHFSRQEASCQAAGSTPSALKESGASIQLKALIDNIDGGIALMEIADEIRAMYLSRSCVRLMQLSYEKMKQADNRFLSCIHPDDVGTVDEALRRGACSDEHGRGGFPQGNRRQSNPLVSYARGTYTV